MRVQTFLLLLVIGWLVSIGLRAHWNEQRTRQLMEQTGAVSVEHPANFVHVP